MKPVAHVKGVPLYESVSITDTAGVKMDEALSLANADWRTLYDTVYGHECSFKSFMATVEELAAPPAPSVADDPTVSLEAVISEFEAKHGPISQPGNQMNIDREIARKSLSEASEGHVVEIALINLYEFQEVTGCDTASEFSPELTALRERIATLEAQLKAK